MAAAMNRARLRSGLRAVRLLYFMHFAGVGVYWTYINVYYQSIGLSGTQIGLVNAIIPLVGIASMTGWGLLNDRFGRTRFLLMLAALGTLLSVLGLSRMASFIAIIPLACAFSVFSSAVIPLLDTTTLGLLGSHREFYGKQRIWGSVGYMVTSAGVGFILERMGLHSMFGIYALIVAGLAVAAVLLPQQPVQISAFSLSGLSVMLRRPPWLVFTVSLFLLGIGFAGVSNFVSVTISTMGGSDSLIGLAWMFAAVSELPVMFFSVALLRRFGSARILALAMLLYVGRFLLYGAMTSPVWALFINLGFGCAFGMYWLSAVTYINELAPDNLKTTSQSLFMSVMNLSNVLGAVITGWLFDRVGPSGMFYTLAGLSSCALLLFVVGRTVLGRRELRSPDTVVVKEMLHD